MHEINPYAAPAGDASLAPQESSWQGLWRDKRDLVMHKNAKLPSLCVKTGESTTQRGIVRKMSWHTPWIALTIFAGILIYVILALVLRKKATIEIPLSDNARGRRTTRIILSWVTALGSLAFMAGCIFVLMNARNASPIAVIGIFGGLIGFIAAALIGQSAAQVLRPTKITDTHVWLRGVHPSILEQLPPVPPG